VVASGVASAVAGAVASAVASAVAGAVASVVASAVASEVANFDIYDIILPADWPSEFLAMSSSHFGQYLIFEKLS
jgi:hypothetical protein